MKEYLASLVLVAAVVTLAGLLIPEGDARTRRLIEFGLGLLVLTVILQPLSSLKEFSFTGENIFSPIPEAGNAPSLPPESLEKLGEGIARGIERDIASRYRIPADCIRATVTPVLTGDELKIGSLLLSFHGAAQTADLLAIERYAEETYGAECEVKTNGIG